MIKVPATPAGHARHPARSSAKASTSTSRCCSRATRYEAVAEAYIDGLEARAGRGGDRRRRSPASPASSSAASTPPSTRCIDGEAEDGDRPSDKALLEGLLGKVAIANAKLAYQRYKQIFSGPRWEALAAQGRADAAPAVGEHRHQEPALPRRALRRGADRARHGQHHAAGHARRLPRPRPPARRASRRTSPAPTRCSTLWRGRHLAEGGHRRAARRRRQAVRRAVRQAARRPSSAAAARRTRRASTRQTLHAARLRSQAAVDGDARGLGRTAARSRGSGRRRRLALDRAPTRRAGSAGSASSTSSSTSSEPLARSCSRRSEEEGFTHALLLGMGGSSLCPEVLEADVRHDRRLARSCSCSTRPIRRRSRRSSRRSISRSTLFIVSSKSGSTLEPNIFKAYFFERVKQASAPTRPAATSSRSPIPDSKLEKVAERDGFRHVFAGVPSIGGRYSALSNFGMVPAAVMGLDVERAARRAPTAWCTPARPRARRREPRRRARADPRRARPRGASTS